jgi:hypothetical protein
VNRVRTLRERLGPSSSRAKALAVDIRPSALYRIETGQQDLDQAKIRAPAD